MIAVVEKTCPLKIKADIVRFVESEGFRVQISENQDSSLVSVIGHGTETIAERLSAMPGVRDLRHVGVPYPLVSREHRPDNSCVRLENVVFGGNDVVVIAGPCAVESRAQILAIAEGVASAGAVMLRGGAFKPRSSPYSFQGLEHAALDLLAEAREQTGLKVVTEVIAPEDVSLISGYADMLQVGARNMQNFRLLSAVGAQGRPVLLKRGMMATIDELLFAAEYIVSAGNHRVVLCDRGIRTFETSTRNGLDISAVPVLKEKTHLPVIVDPSHASGRRELVPALARAAVAVGADGVMVEVHHDPDTALCDGPQSLPVEAFKNMMGDLRRLADAVGRQVGAGATNVS